MESNAAPKWEPIQDLPSNWAELGSVQTHLLAQAWLDQASDMRERQSYQDFLLKLRRKWAIETGVLERLYDLKDGVTKALIEKGFDAALFGHDDSNLPPGEVIALIEDQYAAIEGLSRFVGGERALSKSYIRELHQIITAHQKHCEGSDGASVDLLRGEWKKWENVIDHEDGIKTPTCPPEHVDRELERLIEMHAGHARKGVPPDVEAAWIHHRFSLIHPFQDGNGRIARCLSTLVLLKAQWFPLVLSRENRTSYIGALRTADRGELKPLVELFNTLQNRAIREAFCLSGQIEQEDRQIKNILAAARAKFEEDKKRDTRLRNQACVTADVLFSVASERIKELAYEVQEVVRIANREFAALAQSANRESKERTYNAYQIGQCARSQEYFANRDTYAAWASLVIITDVRFEILFSFHGMGASHHGILACGAVAFVKQRPEAGEESHANAPATEITPLSDEPFAFTYQENPNDAASRFRVWLNDRLADGLALWKKRQGA